MMGSNSFKFWRSLLVFLRFHVVTALDEQCSHCAAGAGFEDVLLPDNPGTYHSDVHVLWSTHLEAVPITKDIGGWESPSLHQKLAAEAIRGWQNFRDNIAPKLAPGHHVQSQLKQKHSRALNDGFFQFQRNLYGLQGDVQATLEHQEPIHDTPPPGANTSWPEMNALPEYQKLREVVEKLSRRYLIRSGMQPDAAHALNYSIFNWADINGRGEVHGPATHTGAFHVGVFYAQTGAGVDRIRFDDPRGHSPPYGRYHYHVPKAGELIFFPSWLSYASTVAAASSDTVGKDSTETNLRSVVFTFILAPVEGPLPSSEWWSDPTSEMRFTRSSPIDPEQFKI